MIDLAAAANPDWAAEAVERLDADALPAGEDARRRLAVLLGSSQAFGDLLASRPQLLEVLDEAEPTAWDAATIRERARTTGRDAGWLLDIQREGLLRVALRDLLGLVDTPQTAEELSDLADGVLGAALDEAVADEAADAAEVAVLAMGKLGGQELNYVSDVDVIFVHRGDTAAAERVARRVMQVAGGHGPGGVCYEVDANLRPEGRNGPLTRTLESYEAYYERWAKTWEFQALLKVRPIAGPPDLGEAFEALVAPRVWPESLGGDAVEEIQAMKRRVERSKPVVRDGERQLKLAPGGLRDIEFAVQLLQLVHGPADPELRARGTLPALSALAHGGYVDDGDANLFDDAYRFLRTVEHRLQLRQLRRTHTIPADDAERQRLARTVGFRDLPVRSAVEAFDRELARVRTGVRRIHQQLFYRPLLATIASWGIDERVADGQLVDGQVAEDRRLDADAVRTRLHALSFDAPGQALRHLEAMLRGSGRTARQLRVVLPAMLEALSDTPDPDAGLAALRSLAESLRDNPRFLRTVRDNPAAARHLARVLGASPRLGEWFGRQPEVLRLFDEPEALARPRTREELHAGAAGLVRRGGGGTSGDALRRYKRREALRAAVRSVTGEADVVTVGQELTWLSEGLLQAALATVLADEDVRLSIIALGRFGAGELSHSSDLDVMFVHEGDTAVAEEAATAVVDLLAQITPEGAAFRIDTGLRPEGRHGPLSRSLDSHLAYYGRWAGDWELLAMTQARPVAGDEALGQAFIDGMRPLVYADPVPTERLVAVRKMKARLESERAGGKAPRPAAQRPRRTPPSRPRSVRSITAQGSGRGGPRTSRDDLKLGPGGLSDVEWTVQLLGLVHGATDPSVRVPGTLPALDALVAAGALTGEEGVWLRSGWTLLSQVRNTLYLVGERETSSLPQSPDRLARLAHAMHYDAIQELTQDVDRARRRIRKVFDRRFFA
ncbi:bifunctional [glutamine synthetase] adenylyltransferase/[glutamine synthetase]-adenylyl-L-tyrosine phosphorylase [Euzebya sp.]|uniref:bifunctional [glutamine synthetase] adenylyltransferase/[glutamine synthetase]-adenylyl-L-tyrosine phosphorylase n=1 Tax=Euzebya sp. TaxID=1971409 RepID=UPI003510DBEE